MKRIAFIVVIIFAVISSCVKIKSKEKRIKVFDYPNLLDLKGIPQQAKDYNSFCFSDKGSWFGFGLAENVDTSFIGFSGPFLMNTNNGKWLSKQFVKLEVLDIKTQEEYVFNKNEITNTYYPGLLEQNSQNQKFNIKQYLWFASSNIAINKIKIINKSEYNKEINLNYSISYFDTLKYSKKLNKSSYILSLTDSEYILHFPSEYKTNKKLKFNKGKISVDSLFVLKPSDTLETYIIYELNIDNNKISNIQIQDLEFNLDKNYKKNIKNWNKKIADVINLKGHFSDSIYKKLAVKSLITLTNNWRSEYGDLHFDGLFPSYSYEWFYGFWSWDSWKQAVAVTKFDENLAKEQILTMFDYQDSLGMIPDVIYHNAEENNWRDTKPPLAGWAVYKIFVASNDTAFVKEILPKLVKYHYWWYKYRDHDFNGLCEFGSTDGTRIAAAWESGMDNAVRFDEAIMLKNSENAYSLNQESVDLNSYLYAEKQYLLKLAKIVNNISIIDGLEQESLKLKQAINSTFWDSETGYYYDVRIFNKEKIFVQGPESWIPLWAGVASKKQAELVKQKILDRAKFNTKCPFPTLATDNLKFDPLKGYWRGPVWFDQAYFAIEGLSNYGYCEDANKIAIKLLNNAEGLVNSNKAIRENYHPLTGEGLNANNFSWTAAHILMIMDVEK